MNFRLRPLLILAFALASLGAHARISRDVVAEKELLITDLSVVEDARAKGTGPWSFGGLVAKLAAGKNRSSDLVVDWLRQWSDVRSLNGFPVEPRESTRLESLWPERAAGRFDPANSPFRLTAIVYRPDIRNAEAPFGEARMVFCGIRPEDHAGIDFYTIFEFQIPSDGAAWASAFHHLGDLPLGPAFNSELERVTEHLFTRENLLRARTNDFFADSIWELRQFELDGSGRLVQVPVPGTPDLSFNDADGRSKELVAWAKENASSLLLGKAELPVSMRAAASVAPRDSFRWLYGQRDGLPEPVRHALSVATCNGCHSGETGTVFSHIGARGARSAAQISPFLRRELPLRASSLIDRLAGK